MAISTIRIARNKVAEMMESHEQIKYALDREIELFESKISNYDVVGQLEFLKMGLDIAIQVMIRASSLSWELAQAGIYAVKESKEAVEDGIPDNVVAGTAVGGQVAAPADSAVEAAEGAAKVSIHAAAIAAKKVVDTAEIANLVQTGAIDLLIGMEDKELAIKEAVLPWISG